jgi:hypothetical protein
VKSELSNVGVDLDQLTVQFSNVSACCEACRLHAKKYQADLEEDTATAAAAAGCNAFVYMPVADHKHTVNCW